MQVHEYPQKKFGQNFLINNYYATKIIDALHIGKQDTIVEIGPGRGALTEIISSIDCKQRIAVEIDPNLAVFLQSNFANIEILQQDILSFSYRNAFNQTGNRLKVVGNIPYNITSAILFHILQNSAYISQAILMIQKEVALRLIAEKDKKAYGILTILVNAQANVKKLFTVTRKNFYPQPKVDSMVIRLQFFKNESDIKNYALFKSIVKTTFNNRRKMLRNSLSKIVPEKNLKKIKSIPLNLRPENLSVADFLRLTTEIANFHKA